MKKLSYNEQMKTNGGRKVCFYINGYIGAKGIDARNRKKVHYDYYMGRSGRWYKYGH